MIQIIVKNIFLLIIIFIVMVGCGEKEPEYVYVPSSNYEESLAASIVDSGKEIKTNEWVSQKATRITGPSTMGQKDFPGFLRWIEVISKS